MKLFDFIILVVVILSILIVGYYSGKKEKTSKEFLLAGKNINKIQAGFSMAATDFGGSGLVAAIGYCYIIGMSGIWWNLAAVPAFLLVGLMLAKKFNKMNSSTVPEYLGKRYSPVVKYLATIMHVLTNIASLSVQYTVACATLYAISDINMTLSLIICVLLVVILTSGGLRTVINTDSLLFVVIVCSVLIAVPVMLHVSGGFSTIRESLPGSFFQIDRLGFWTPFSWILLCLLNYSTNQNYIQRMVASKNEGTARFGALFTAGFYLIISISIGIIGICAHIALPGISNTNTVFPQILRTFFPAGLVGLGVAGVFAATISTATSILHSTTTLIINDLWIPLQQKVLSESKKLMISKIIIIVIALFSTLISIFNTNIINVLYVSGLFYSVSVFLPMLLGMHDRSITASAALISIIGTVIISLLWEYVLKYSLPVLEQIPSNLIGLIISFILLELFSRINPQKLLC